MRRTSGLQPELLAARAEITQRDVVEAALDGAPDVGEEAIRDLSHVGDMMSIAPAHRRDRRKRDGPFDGTENVSEPHVVRRARKPEAAARAALRLDQPGALELLEDLLEEAQRDALPP